MVTILSHFLPGNRDTLVIVFGEKWNHYKDQRFWGERALQKAGFPAYGISSDGPHWYPVPETVLALREAVKESRRYRHTVLYGYSMGANAALRYSWLFDDPVVLSFSPQFSIDPADIGHIDDRYTSFFNPETITPRIESADTHGRGYIFYDPLYPADLAHVDRIAAPQIKVPLHHCGHETIQTVSSAMSLRRLINDATAGDHSSVRRLVRFGRRRNPFYAKYLIRALIVNSHYRLVAKVSAILSEAYAADPETLAMAADAFRYVGDKKASQLAYQLAYDVSGDQKYLEWSMSVGN